MSEPIRYAVSGGPPPPDALSLPAICPKCGAPTEMGYGLAGGGIGPYVMCDSEDGCCDFFAKKQDPEGRAVTAPVEASVDAVARCVKCGATKAAGCACWVQCKCGWMKGRDERCTNPIHRKRQP